MEKYQRYNAHFSIEFEKNMLVLQWNFVLKMNFSRQNCTFLFYFMFYMILHNIAFSGNRISQKMCLTGKFGKAFLHYLVYLMIFQSFTAPSVCSTLKNHQIWQQLDKNEKTPCATCLKTHFSMALLPKPESRVLCIVSITK